MKINLTGLLLFLLTIPASPASAQATPEEFSLAWCYGYNLYSATLAEDAQQEIKLGIFGPTIGAILKNEGINQTIIEESITLGTKAAGAESSNHEIRAAKIAHCGKIISRSISTFASTLQPIHWRAVLRCISAGNRALAMNSGGKTDENRTIIQLTSSATANSYEWYARRNNISIPSKEATEEMVIEVRNMPTEVLGLTIKQCLHDPRILPFWSF